MGVGLYGSSGLNPIVTREMMSLYVVPWMLYGLETQMLGWDSNNKDGLPIQNPDQKATILSQICNVYLLYRALSLDAILRMSLLKRLKKVATN